MTTTKKTLGLRLGFLSLVLISALPAFGLILVSGLEQRKMASEQAQQEALIVTRTISLEHTNHIHQTARLLQAFSKDTRISAGDGETCSAQMAMQLSQFPEYDNFGAVDPQGHLICSALPLQADITVSDLGWFQHVMQSGTWVVGDYQVSRVTGEPIMVIAYSVVADEKIERILFAALNIAWLNEVWEISELPYDSTVTLIDSSGTILARYPKPEAWIGKKLPEAPLIQRIIDQREGTFNGSGIDGVNRLYAYNPIDTDAGERIYVAVGIPAEAAYQKANTSLVRNIAWLGIIFVIVLAIAWFGGRTLFINRLLKLVDASRLIESGNLNARSGFSKSGDSSEIGQVASSFDHMAEALQARTEAMSAALEALRASEQKFRSLAETAASAIIIYESDKIFYVNPAGEQILGYSQQELAELSTFDIVHPDDRELVAEHAQLRLARDDSASRYEFRVINRDGGVRWLDFTAGMIEYEGQAAGLGTALDITERKQVEALLRQSETGFRLLFLNNPLPMWVYDLETLKFLEVNDTAVQKYGWSRDEFLQMGITQIRPAEDLPKLMTHLAQARPPLQFSGPWTHYLKNGQKIQVEIISHTIEFSGRQASMAVVNDITDRLQVDQVLKRQYEEMNTLFLATQAGVQCTSVDDLFQRFIDSVSGLLYPHNFGIAVIDYETNQIDLHSSYRSRDECLHVQLKIGQGIIGKVVETGVQMRVADVRESDVYVLGDPDTRSELAVPVMVDGQVFCVINTESPEVNAFSENDERLLITLSNELSTAIQKLQLLEKERSRRKEAETMREIGSMINSTLDFNSVLVQILTQLKNVVPYDAASVALLQDGQFHIAARQGLFIDRVSRLDMDAKNLSHIHELVRNARPVIIADTQQCETWVKSPTTGHIRCWMGIPLILKREVIGFFSFDHNSANFYTADDAQLALGIAHQAAIAIHNAMLFADLENSHKELGEAYEQTIEGWSRVLDLRDRETEGHTQRVTKLTLRLAAAMGVGGEELVHIRRGALLHDIGKMGIPDEILFKPGPLTEDEWRIMRKHPELAIEMMKPIQFLCLALDIPACHHERWDGTGYPHGISGEAIPLAARIFAIVDVWDALISDRPYRKAWPKEKALAHIRAQSGRHFDPAIVEPFLAEIQK